MSAFGIKIRKNTSVAGVASLLFVAVTTGCQGVIDDRIPSMPVAINLSDPAVWNTYGVSGFGMHRDFILFQGLIQPAGFPYSSINCTGFGGVLLISGMDPFTSEAGVPLAYDLACPIEREQTVRVAVDPETLDAVCPVCDSHYDVTMGAGAPVAGPALTGTKKYGLRRYRCIPSGQGGYIITD